MRGRFTLIALLLALGISLSLSAQTAPQAHPSRTVNTPPGSVPGQSGAAATVPASNPRVQSLSGQLLCMCGCDQILNQCNHQGTDRCLTHDTMMAELERRVAGGESNSLILQSFVQEYGPQVLVVPPASGFDLTAWLMPIFAGLAGLTLALVVVQRWRERGLKPAQASAGDGAGKVRPDLVERARNETRDEDY